MSLRAASRPAFTITELLIVIAVIVVLIGLLLPALGGVWRSAEMTKSMNNLRQIALWMRQYSSDNTEYILPSQFNYTGDPYPGKVRSGNVALGPQHMGTWSDILWSVFEVGAFEDQASPGAPNYRFDSPDQALYDKLGRWDENIFRSAAANSRSVDAGTGPRPFGTGAQEAGEAGYFAANQFFNADPNAPDPNWYTLGQIKLPSQSMYLIDSFAGEVIEDDLDPGGPFDNTTGSTSLEVDFRYGDACLMLFLDGHIDQQGTWREPSDLEGRNVRVRDLTSR